MSVRNRKVYCVFGCAELGAYMHRFPHPDRQAKMFSTWIQIVGAKLRETDPWRIYKNKKVCDYHFKTEHKVASHRLCAAAVPSLHLNGIFSSPVIKMQLEHNYCLPRMYREDEDPKFSGRTDLLMQQSSDEALQSRLDLPSTSKAAMDKALQSRLDLPSTSKAAMDKGQKSCNRKSPAFLLKEVKEAKKKIRNLKTQAKKASAKAKSYKTRLANAEKAFRQNTLEKITRNMTTAGKVFTGMQYKQALKKPKGRRYNTEEKILALSLYKKSPKCYSLLSKYFKLPSSKTLRNLLKDVKLRPGINKIIFEKLKDTVDELDQEDRLCSLIFDEMSLTPNIQYSAPSDELKGFVTNNNEMQIANHVLVFMVKGIKMPFKQPVAYYFTNSLKQLELKKVIQDVIRHTQNTGLKVLCTVCDQGATNVSTINSLIEDTKRIYLKRGIEWREDIFQIDGRKIIPLFDVPHLLKGIRNNLLTKDLQYQDLRTKETKTVKWEYFQKLYEADKSYGELRLLHKLTEEHVVPDKIKKMRVKMAAQVFSHSVAVTTEHLTARGDLPEECRQLIPMVMMFDKLFDSMNASTYHIPNGKIYRGAVRKNSPHHELWKDGVKFLKSIKFIKKKKEGTKIRLIESMVPSVKNFIKTLEGMQSLWKILSIKYNVKAMLTRNLNQDPIENFFGSVRSLGVRNISPSCLTFEGAFKTLLLNNFSSPHSVNANCEEDFNKCLQNLDFFIKEKEKYKADQENNEYNDPKHIELNESMCEVLSGGISSNISDWQQREYVCGWILSKCLSKIIKSCKICRSTMVSNKLKGNEYIRAKEYNKNKRWLCYPSDQLKNCFNDIQDIATTYLKTNSKNCGLKTNIKLLLEAFVSFPNNCEIHKDNVKNHFYDLELNILIYSWCKSINRILSGKLTYVDTDDSIKQKAQNYFNIHKNKKY